MKRYARGVTGLVSASLGKARADLPTAQSKGRLHSLLTIGREALRGRALLPSRSPVSRYCRVGSPIRLFFPSSKAESESTRDG